MPTVNLKPLLAVMSCAMLFAWLPPTARAGDATAAESGLALSAAPESLRSGAGVWIRNGEGYRQLRTGTNGWQCIVIQETPQTLEPECYDSDAALTLMPVDEYKRKRALEGLAQNAIQREVRVRYANGTFRPPRAGDIIYMLSHRNRVLAAAGHVISFPPHVMIAAPYKTKRDIGGESAFAFLVDEGSPNALIIVPVDSR